MRVPKVMRLYIVSVQKRTTLIPSNVAFWYQCRYEDMPCMCSVVCSIPYWHMVSRLHTRFHFVRLIMLCSCYICFESIKYALNRLRCTWWKWFVWYLSRGTTYLISLTLRYILFLNHLHFTHKAILTCLKTWVSYDFTWCHRSDVNLSELIFSLKVIPKRTGAFFKHLPISERDSIKCDVYFISVRWHTPYRTSVVSRWTA